MTRTISQTINREPDGPDLPANSAFLAAVKIRRTPATATTSAQNKFGSNAVAFTAARVLASRPKK